MLTIEVKKGEESRFQFLNELDDYERSYPTKPDEYGYVHINYFYNKNFGLFERIGVRTSIRRRGGSVVDFLPLSKRPPRISPKTKIMFRDNALYFLATYLPALIGFPLVSPKLGIDIGFLNALQLALIPSLFLVIVRLMAYFKVR